MDKLKKGFLQKTISIIFDTIQNIKLTQKNVKSTGMIISILMGIFPPCNSGTTQNYNFVGYHFIFYSPYSEANRGWSNYSVNYNILILQWIIVGVVTYLCIYLVNSQANNK